MRIFYLSTTSFADCEMALLNEIGKSDVVQYGVIIPQKNNNFSESELKQQVAPSVSLLPVQLKYRFRDPRQIFAYIKLLLAIRKFKPDVIYINFFHDVYFNLLSIPFLKSCKTIIGVHDVLHHSGTKNTSLLNVIEKALLKKFRNTLTFSTSQATLLKEKYPDHRVFTIPLMLKDFGEKRKEVLDYSTINFLFFGNIQSYKGLDVLLQAVNLLQSKYTNFRLTIAGRCKDWKTAYEPLITNSGNISKEIRFIENSEIPAFFSKAHYLVLPYKDVTQSGPLMIAYNYNLPVICSDIDGFKEFVNEGKTGFLFNNNEVTALAQIMENAIVRPEADYKQLVGQVADYKEQHFAAHKIKNAYLSMFDEISSPPLTQANFSGNHPKISNSIA